MSESERYVDLSDNETKLLHYMSEVSSKGFVEEEKIRIPQMDMRAISSSISWLAKKGLIDVSVSEYKQYSLGPEGTDYLENGLPEERVYQYLLKNGSTSVKKLSEALGDQVARVGLTQLAKAGIKPRDGILEISTSSVKSDTFSRRRECLEGVKEGSQPDEECVQYFKKRGTVLLEKKISKRLLRINKYGMNYISTNKDSMAGQITPQMLTGGSWRNLKFRKYDLNLRGESVRGAFLHPLTYLRNEVAQIFLQMGFSEMKGHFIEYSGWNMDALFIPQDHPARDMQDTFYLTTDTKPPFEHEELMNRIQIVHETGTGNYSGWGYKWNPEQSRRLLLRTHTTVSTVRSLYELQKSPSAVFSIDRVFRHESVDWKHLAELHQIEGAYYAEDANLSTLKWLMEEFYRRLGFESIKLVPSYYPYTEPSMDVVVKINGKEVELGGSGVFRPEVMKPLGLESPAIAWGLGLERLAMLYYNLEDIRGIYQSDIEWLQTYRLRP